MQVSRFESKPLRKARDGMAMFADEASAHRFLERLLWPDGVRCPRCRSSARVRKLNGASTRVAAYKCYACRKPFSSLHGTVMSSSHVPAHKWLQAIYLTEGGTRPMRPYHLHRILNVSFKTASSMMKRLGRASAQTASGSGNKGPATRSTVTLAICRNLPR
ncbi:transposase [Reyranella soli]|uniref:transposase n=1 Tax=Reyranella soli TaxID=1230389 RepID=UPI0011BD7006|nr:transposase [Reyranella soli]